MRARTAALVLSLVGVFAILILTRSGGDAYRLRVQVNDAAGLRKDFLVKIAGAPVGKVSDVRLDRDDHAIAVLQLDAGAAPVGTDARAAIRASNLLGEKYVDLMPGDVGRPARSGFEIPRSRTTTASDLDDVLSVLDLDTRVALMAFFVNEGEALVGRGGDLAATLHRLPPALDQAHALLEGLASDNHALTTLVDRSDRILAAVTPQRAALGRLVDSAGGALDTLDGERAALGDTVRRAPGAIRQLRASLGQLQAVSVPLAPAARGLQATAGPLTATLRALPAFAAAARPTLRTARAVAPDLGRLGREAAPVVRRLEPVTSSLRTFATAVDPVTKLLDEGIADTLGTMQGWARSIQNRDAAGHVFRLSVELGGDIVNAANAFIAGTGARHAPQRPSHARPTQGTSPAVPQSQSPLLKLPTLELPAHLGPVDLTPVQQTVKPLLDFLLKP